MMDERNKRRVFLKKALTGTIIAGAVVAGGMTMASRKGWAVFGLGKDKKAEAFPVTLTDAQWQERLSPEAYRVLRKHGTEPSRSSPLDAEYGAGVYQCAGCAFPLFSSTDKFDSRTGWPSFTRPINEGAVGTTTDYKLFYPRTEVHCANCGGHLGHVFDDGPEPTGLRYCMNGVAMAFIPAEKGTTAKETE